MTKYPIELLTYIRENAKGKTNKEITAMVNAKFQTDFEVKTIKSIKSNHKISSGLTGYFVKGNEPYNKGKKGKTVGRMAETQFKKNHKPHNYRPIGSERVTVDGYVYVKVADPSKWREKHKELWEAAHKKPIPKGHKIIFADHDRTNFNIDNLLLIKNSELAVMNRFHLCKTNEELTKIGLNAARLMMMTSQIHKRKKNKNIVMKGGKQHE